jgi:hypothetical protein
MLRGGSKPATTKQAQAINLVVANMALFEEMIEGVQGDGVGR